MSRAGVLRRTGLAVLAFVVGGCTDGGDGTEDGSTADAFDLVRGGTLTVCTDAPNEPFQYEDPGAPTGFGGFDIELAQAVAADLDLELEVRDTDFDRITDGSAMAAGRCDLAASAIAINEAWRAALDFSAPYHDVQHSLLVRTGSQIGSLGDADGARIGVQTGTTALAYLEEHLPDDAAIVEFASPGDLLGAVVAEDVDAVLQELAVNAEHARSDDGLEIVETFDTGERYGFAVEAERDDGLLAAVDRSLDAIRDDGTYEAIHQRYFGR